MGRGVGWKLGRSEEVRDRPDLLTNQEILMSPTIGLPPPSAEPCLDTSRVSRFKGGTLVAEDVRDLVEHQRRMADADAYRPSPCPTCGNPMLHVHCRPERHPKREPSLPPVLAVLQFRCADAGCGATWRVLPQFLARHIWHAWTTVERVVRPTEKLPKTAAPPVPATTQRRWQGRLASSARVLCVLLAISGGVALADVAMGAGLDATRGELLDAFNASVGIAIGRRLSALAVLLHRLERGIRLM
jgi:hypothetical protein